MRVTIKHVKRASEKLMELAEQYQQENMEVGQGNVEFGTELMELAQLLNSHFQGVSVVGMEQVIIDLYRKEVV